jgi:ferritin-like metal-binding protein YciE
MSATLNTLKDLYIAELQDLYSAETQLIKALPKMAMAANNEDLKKGFESHLKETKQHVIRLEKIFEDLGEIPGSETCEAMQGLIAEGAEIIESEGDENVKDAALISAAQRVEHYEIAAYGTTRTFAEHLGFDSHVNLLEETLEEEGDADDDLTTVAEGSWLSSGVNQEAAATR